MRVLHAAVEFAPLVSTGGLGEVLGALPAAQVASGLDARLILPAYGFIEPAWRHGEELARFEIGGLQCRIVLAPQNALPVYFCEIGTLFARDGDPYRDTQNREFDDNPERFAAFCKAIAHWTSSAEGLRVDAVHLHDWHTGLVPGLLKQSAPHIARVYSVHNLAYQGACEPARLAVDPALREAGLHPQHGWSFMAAGLRDSDCVLTVSPRYAQEIQTPAQGCGLDGLLRDCAARGALQGIVNGIDTAVWNPRSDDRLAQRYDVDSVLAAKRVNRAALGTELGLPAGERPLLGFVGRLTEQKGADVLLAALQRESLPLDAVIIGLGDTAIVAALRALARHRPRLVFCEVYDSDLVHRLLAAADLVAMPSRWEPCGMVQLYAQAYGAIPVVHATGGLRDTVVDADPEALAAGRASGIRFEPLSAEALVAALHRGLRLVDDAEALQGLRSTMMNKPLGWDAAARAYAEVYARVAGRRERIL